jgi:RHS repeat-associated protein
MGESFSAQPSTGVGSFSVPFAIPPARGDAQASLVLSYSSAAGSGIVGQGWSLSTPFIARQTDRGVPTYAEASAAGHTFDPNQDRFVFNGGQELVPVCVVSPALACDGAISNEVMPAWAAGAMYFRARVEGSFLRFFWLGDKRTWRVQDKSGVHMEFGVPLDGTGDASALDAHPTRPGAIYRWNLVRQYDPYGDIHGTGVVSPHNVVVYRYSKLSGATGPSYLTAIYHTTPASRPRSTLLDDYAVGVRLDYEARPDVSASYRSGFELRLDKRLARVTVWSKPYGTGTAASLSSARRLVRRYHLAYVADRYASQLASVQLEGRCAEDEAAAPTEAGSAATCGRLPPMLFAYSRVPGGAEKGLSGFEPFDTQVRQVTQSPPHSMDEELTEFFDVNADALADVLVTAPSRYFDANGDGVPDVVGAKGGGHGLFLNGAGGRAAAFASARVMGIRGVGAVNATTLMLSNSNVAALDLDGDGVSDLLHMPKVRDYSLYSAAFAGKRWEWVGRPATAAGTLATAIDLTRDASNIRVMDVNGDGLVDVLRSTTELQTYFSLGRFPGGDGRFGTGRWTSASAAALSPAPVAACRPYSGSAVRLSDADVYVADMNGDGLPDIVRLRPDSLIYWPGRGDGTWGTGNSTSCVPGGVLDKHHVAVASSPRYYANRPERVRLDDVNGDGLDDVVQVREDAVDIWLNKSGIAFTPRFTIKGTPANVSVADRVRLLDINGSGTRDIVWGNARNYQYIDLTAGIRPALLTEVRNGLGRVTQLEYTTSTSEMLAADANPACPAAQQDNGSADVDYWSYAWCSRVPTVVHMVKRLTDSDSLGSSYVTEYDYRDPVFDGRQREFRGFRHSRSRRLGDANSPTDESRSSFLLGQCLDPNAADGDDCSPAQRWLDNPREALKGLPVVQERRDAAGRWLFTTARGYALRELYLGLDGRRVMHAVETVVSTDQYATANPQTGSGLGAMDATALVVYSTRADSNPLRTVPRVQARYRTRDTATYARTAVISNTDGFGNRTSEKRTGCTTGPGCLAVRGAADESVTVFTQATRVAEDAGGWLFRTGDSYVYGTDVNQRRHVVRRTYDKFGALLTASSLLGNPGTLTRYRDSGDKAVAPVPASAAKSQRFITVTSAYDSSDLGLLLKQVGPAGRCRELAYDLAAYGTFVTGETTYTGADCTGRALSMSVAAYDRGFGIPLQVVDVQEQLTKVAHDEFGRLKKLWTPHPKVAETTPLTDRASFYPDVLIEYSLAREDRPWSELWTRTADGPGTYVEAYSLVDGLGRTRVQLTEADASSGPGGGHDAGNWVVAGVVDYDAKGNPFRAYEPEFVNDVRVALPYRPRSAWREQSYDAFDRPLESTERVTTAGRAVALRKSYGALCVDLWDAADLGGAPPSPLPAGTAVRDSSGTYATTCQDGHGRARRTTERVRLSSGALEERHVLTDYLPTGEAIAITRRKGSHTSSASPSVVRTMAYDTLGRMTLNVEPNASATRASATGPIQMAWRYVYDDAGELVGTSDPRGCGINFEYDAAGRLKSEDYSPCEEQHAPYSSDKEVVYVYDDIADSPVPPPANFTYAIPRFARGRLLATFDRASAQFVQYDGRGRVVSVVRQLARADATDTMPIGSRYASRAYRRSFTYDQGNRELSRSTGATGNHLMGSGAYESRGAVSKITSSYGTLIADIYRDADGLSTQIGYGDLAKTSTSFTYNSRRLLETVVTSRAPPAPWTDGVATGYAPRPLYSADSSNPVSFQTLLQQVSLHYDAVGNPVRIADERLPHEWPAGAKPVTRTIQYDDLYRATRIDYSYAGGSDGWVSPFAAEVAERQASSASPKQAADPRRAFPAPHTSFDKRVGWQSWDFDWLGNTTRTADDASGFLDRSLGDIENDAAKPYQLKTASLTPTTGQPDRSGSLTTSYDAAGNLRALGVVRRGACLGGTCSQRYDYEWDEVGRLARARRWDFASTDSPTAASPVPNATAAVDLRYSYDASDTRVLKVARDGECADKYPADLERCRRHTAYIFDTLELRRAKWLTPTDATAPDYELSVFTENVYLTAGGKRLGRVLYDIPAASGGMPTYTAANLKNGQHVLLMVGDHLGSTSSVIDLATGELVESSTFYGYGATESDYRTARWRQFREDYKFTGKEEDVEVGLQYFGKRFLNPYLGRWMSADPLAVHVPGQADLNLYAYVHGAVLFATDPDGLCDPKVAMCEAVGSNADGTTMYGDGTSEPVVDNATGGPSIDVHPLRDQLNPNEGNEGAPGDDHMRFEPVRNELEKSAGATQVFVGVAVVASGPMVRAALGPTIGPIVTMEARAWVPAVTTTRTAVSRAAASAASRRALASELEAAEARIVGALEGPAAAAPGPGASLQAAEATGTVWDAIKVTQAAKPGTTIPHSFELATSGGRFWVHPNATKHMVEYVTRNGASHGMPINSQAMLTSLQGSVEAAAQQGIRFGEAMQVGRWELVFSQGRAGDALPVLKHALYK